MKKILGLILLFSSFAHAQSNSDDQRVEEFIEAKRADIQRMKEKDVFAEILQHYKDKNPTHFFEDLISGKTTAESLLQYSSFCEEVFKNIASLYRSYGMNYDYFRSIGTINNFEKLSAEILKNRVTQNDEQKNEYNLGIQIYGDQAREYKRDLLEKHGPLEFLQIKYDKAVWAIKQKKIDCQGECKTKLDQVPLIIKAVQLHPKSPDNNYLLMLGYEITPSLTTF